MIFRGREYKDAKSESFHPKPGSKNKTPGAQLPSVLLLKDHFWFFVFSKKTFLRGLSTAPFEYDTHRLPSGLRRQPSSHVEQEFGANIQGRLDQRFGPAS